MPRTTRILIALLLGVITLGCASAQRDEHGARRAQLPGIDGPESTVVAFFQALHKNQPDYANSLIARFDEVPQNAMLDGLRTLGERLESVEWENNVAGSRVRDDTAVVIVRERQEGRRIAPNVDPIYLIHQYGAWRMLPYLTAYDRHYFQFTDEQFDNYRQLEAWFKARKRELEK